MKKLLASICYWWNYVVCKKEHTEKNVVVYGKGVNKKGRVYYYKDIVDIHYIGTKEISRKSTALRVFVKESEYLANTYNA